MDFSLASGQGKAATCHWTEFFIMWHKQGMNVIGLKKLGRGHSLNLASLLVFGLVSGSCFPLHFVQGACLCNEKKDDSSLLYHGNRLSSRVSPLESETLDTLKFLYRAAPSPMNSFPKNS